MPQFVTPSVQSVQKILAMMYGEDTSVTLRDDTGIDDCHVATYVDDDGGLVAVCACDPQFVGYSGAALTMLPAGVVQDMIDSGQFSETVLENFYEVMNICSRVLMSESSPHLRLKDTLAPAAGADAAGGVEGDTATVGFDVSIPRYGAGRVVFTLS